jgi:hypothetical protein
VICVVLLHRSKAAAGKALHCEPCRPYSKKGRSGCSSILRIGTNRFMSTSSVMPIGPSSGSIRCYWPEAAVFAAVELRDVERLVAANQQRLVEKWNEYFSISD